MGGWLKTNTSEMHWTPWCSQGWRRNRTKCQLSMRIGIFFRSQVSGKLYTSTRQSRGRGKALIQNQRSVYQPWPPTNCMHDLGKEIWSLGLGFYTCKKDKKKNNISLMMIRWVIHIYFTMCFKKHFIFKMLHIWKCQKRSLTAPHTYMHTLPFTYTFIHGNIYHSHIEMLYICKYTTLLPNYRWENQALKILKS